MASKIDSENAECHDTDENSTVFKPKILHSHNVRNLKSADFEDKNVLIVGGRWSALDFLYQFMNENSANVKKIYVAIGRSTHLHDSDNFKPQLESGLFEFKDGKQLSFSSNSVTFEDGSVAQIDTVLYCTGYKFSFPFLKDSELIQIEANGKCFGPLYQRIFCINEPTLMFAGQNDNNPLIQVLMEKQILIAKHFVEGSIELPSKDEMLKVYEEERLESAKYGLRNLFKGNVTSQWKYIKSLQSLLATQSVANSELNVKFNSVLNAIVDMFRTFLKKGNFVDFKTYDYSICIPSNFEYDTTEYF